MLCWMSQKTQIMTFSPSLSFCTCVHNIHFALFFPFFYLLPLAPLVPQFWWSLFGQCHNQKKEKEKNNRRRKKTLCGPHSSKNWSRYLSSDESCTVSWTHLPLVMDLCNYFPAMLAGCCFLGRTSHIEFTFFFVLWNWDQKQNWKQWIIPDPPFFHAAEIQAAAIAPGGNKNVFC